MKVAIISDQHFGARKSSKYLHDHFKRFYDDGVDGMNSADYNSIKDAVHSKLRY